MRCACVDIGSNTTRLLVADVSGALPREVLVRKVHTHLGRALREADPAAVGARLAAVVAGQVGEARAAGAARLRVVGTAALRESPAGAAVCAAVEAAAGVAVEVLGGEAEARLAFLGATRTAPPSHPRDASSRPRRDVCRASAEDARRGGKGWVAVVDVGGGSTEIAVGPADGVPAWAVSLPVGSARLGLRGDPPDADALRAAGAAARAAFADLERPGANAGLAARDASGPAEHPGAAPPGLAPRDTAGRPGAAPPGLAPRDTAGRPGAAPRGAGGPPAVTRALAVGGSAASLSRIAGPRLDAVSVAAAVAALTAGPAAAVATRTGLEPERARLLPAGLLLLAAASEWLGRPLELGCGGLREGVCIALAARETAIDPPRTGGAPSRDHHDNQ